MEHDIGDRESREVTGQGSAPWLFLRHLGHDAFEGARGGGVESVVHGIVHGWPFRELLVLIGGGRLGIWIFWWVSYQCIELVLLRFVNGLTCFFSSYLG